MSSTESLAVVAEAASFWQALCVVFELATWFVSQRLSLSAHRTQRAALDLVDDVFDK